jgi:predicted neutral ceramidase superfamily lipid hydrolase
MLPITLGYVMVVAATILVLDQLEIAGFLFGLALTVVSGLATAVFVFVIDRGRLMGGASGAQNTRDLIEVPAGGKGGTLTPVPQTNVRGV